MKRTEAEALRGVALSINPDGALVDALLASMQRRSEIIKLIALPDWGAGRTESMRQVQREQEDSDYPIAHHDPLKEKP